MCVDCNVNFLLSEGLGVTLGVRVWKLGEMYYLMQHLRTKYSCGTRKVLRCELSDSLQKGKPLRASGLTRGSESPGRLVLPESSSLPPCLQPYAGG